MLLIEEILRWSPRKLPRGRLNTLITALLLRTEGREGLLAFEGFVRGRYTIDDTLVEAIFNEVRPRLARLQLAKSGAFAGLPPRTFERLYMRLWRSRDSSDGWRHGLAWSLQMFLRRHEDEGHRYASMISRQMRDPVDDIALLGLFSAGYLGKALTVPNAKYLCAHLDKRSLRTLNALSALAEIYKRWTVTPNPAKRVLSLGAVIEAVEQLGRDQNYKSNAQYCIRAMQKALGH